MCFVSVPGQPGMYRHVQGRFIHTIDVSREQLDEIARKLGVPAETAQKWKPGRIHIVNNPDPEAKKK